MSAAFEFWKAAGKLAPRTAVVLGSGLGGATSGFTPAASVAYADMTGLVPPTVAGHRGQLAVGHWNGVPVLVCFGRVHFYEGHPWDRVTRLVHLVAELGVRRLLLTNAAGGIHPALPPGSLMAIRAHVKLLDPEAWHDLEWRKLYTPRLVELLGQIEPGLLAGTYAALTGPCYETPAEIRALQAIGADAVGMSTAIEAETALALGLEVAGLSSITNKAAGLSDGPLSHKEVEESARNMAARVGALIGKFVAA
jgi:purine-nucleoside phosphorylase